MVQLGQFYSGNVLAAARVLLGLTQSQVASEANISVSTLKRIEAKGEHVMTGQPSNNYRAVVAFLERAGVIFVARDDTADEGVRMAYLTEESRDILERLLLPPEGVRLRKP